MPCGIRDSGEQWYKQLPIAWQHQAIAQTNMINFNVLQYRFPVTVIT